MKCPITYDDVETGQKYSSRGLTKLNSQLKNLMVFPYSKEDQRKEAIKRAAKMSIQGVQEKMSAVLSVKDETFKIVDSNGRYILKPQSAYYDALPENEDLTMKLAATVGLDTPNHGLIYCIDDTLTYFISRFDRYGRAKKYHVEDFAQLTKNSRDTKYDYSMERVADVLSMCTYPAIESVKLFKLVLFNFLVGNEDAHLKNFSLIVREKKAELSPCYDLVNTTIVSGVDKPEEIALTLDGKKRGLTKKDLLSYYGKERLKLTDQALAKTLQDIKNSVPRWAELIKNSFLPEKLKESYRQLVNERANRLGWAESIS